MSTKIQKNRENKNRENSMPNFATNQNQAMQSFAKKIQNSHKSANGRLGGFTRK